VAIRLGEGMLRAEVPRLAWRGIAGMGEGDWDSSSVGPRVEVAGETVHLSSIFYIASIQNYKTFWLF
jgi:hypothetical protein